MRVLTFFIFLFFSTIIYGQQDASNYAPKVSSLDSLITNLYGVISGEKGEARDWDLMKYLFHPDAKLVPTGKNKEGTINARFMTVDDYVTSSGKWLIENGFYEIELYRKVDQFGPISQVFSSYQSFRSKNDTVPFMRGINSIQVLNDGERWWIINIYWSQESKENPIPEAYLPKK